MRPLIVGAVALLIGLGIASPAQAGPDDFSTDFTSLPAELYYTTFEGGVRFPDTPCGVDACASIETSGADTFVRVAVHPSTTPGYYTNTDMAQMDLDLPGITDGGPYTPTFGHPVILSARMRWSATYDHSGEGAAVGTSGVVLWNSAFEGGFPSAEYDQIGFLWASDDILFGAISGFTGSTFINQVPVEVARAIPSVNINNWMNVIMIWSVNPGGVQKVAYSVNGVPIGLHILPTPLQGLSLEIWTDNQEPNPCPDGNGICTTYPNPGQTQSLEVDQVSVTQP